MTRRIHVVGAGLAGLAAALRLSEADGVEVTLWEATQRAGGRCWSFHDATLGRVIDNGNHLILSGNAAVLDHVRRIGAEARLDIAPEAAFLFADLPSGQRWTIRIPAGLGDLVRHGTGLPGSAVRIALDVARLLRAGLDKTVAEVVPGRGRPWTAFWDPMTLAILNEPPERGSARLLAAVLRETVLKGAGPSRPVFAPQGLGPALVDPALDMLQRRGVRIMWRSPLTGVDRDAGKPVDLFFGPDTSVPLGPTDGAVIAAAPAARLVTGEEGPAAGMTILNAHYRVPAEAAASFPPALGLVGGAAHWVFRRDDVLSVTVSAAESTPVARMPQEALLDRLWQDVIAAGGGAPIPCEARRLIRAKRATWDQSPEGVSRRIAASGVPNIALAGDYIAGPLPSSLEFAIGSGREAASRLLGETHP